MGVSPTSSESKNTQHHSSSAEIAFFYEYEAIIVPNARWPTSNVVVLTENTRPDQLEAIDSEPVELAAWYEKAYAGE